MGGGEKGFLFRGDCWGGRWGGWGVCVFDLGGFAGVGGGVGGDGLLWQVRICNVG